MVDQSSQLHPKRVDRDIIQYLKSVHTDLYDKLKAAVLSCRKE
jgi:hypothetical protein